MPRLTHNWVLGEEELSFRVHLLKGTRRVRRNPFSKLNAGLVQLSRRGDGWETRLLLVSSGRRGRHRVMFRSPPL